MKTMIISIFRLSIFLLTFSIASIVNAEGVLIKSEPKQNAEISSSDFDGEIKFWFSGNVGSRFPSVVVADSQGMRIDNHDTRLVIGERSRLTASTKQLTPGPYAVRYRVVTEDGLVVSGIQNFTVKN